MIIHEASWITRRGIKPRTVPVFRKDFDCDREAEEAVLEVTAAGVYDAVLNGQRVGEQVLTPGWTEYHKRLQVQRYEIETPVETEIVIGGKSRKTGPGRYLF